MTYCCERFKKEAGEVKAMAGGDFLYPDSSHPKGQIEPDEDGETWNVNGCCGGGCYVLTDIRFCPFCGNNIVIDNE